MSSTNSHNKPTPVTRTSWRPVGSNDSGTSQSGDGRVLLLINGEGNRRQVERELSRHYTLVDQPADDQLLAPDNFDLAITDGPGLRHWQDALTEAKRTEQPVFLPVMLLLPRAELRQRTGTLASIIDEFIISPIDRGEFLQRVHMLLRTRRQALEQQDELARIVNYDRGTGLPNRNLLRERLRSFTAHADDDCEPVYLMVIHTPLDRMLETFGQRGVDRAAEACAERLQTLLDDGIGLARIGTQDWGLVPDHGTPLEGVLNLCARISRFDEEPIRAGGESLYVRPHIGVATYPNDSADPDGLLDAALAASAQAGTEEPVFYAQGQQDTVLHYLRTEAALRDALAGLQFELWLQPQITLQERRVVGTEALIRWRLPSGELVPPGDFIPVAESSGFISRITHWVLGEAVRMAAELPDGLSIAVNVTPADIGHSGLPEHLLALCGDAGVSPQSLELELTETMMCEMDTATIRQLGTLRQYGFRIAIDDFGTGYSSLGYLHRLPADTLKIDKRFIDGIPGNGASETVTRAIIHLAREFGLEVVAEGIEAGTQMDYLRDAGVAMAQGFHVARPMPWPELGTWLETR